MPFTGSHPAAVLPLLRTPLPASALVIGSMAPDTPYFLAVGLPPTHRPLSAFTVDVVIGLVLWAAWHGWLCAPALATAPGALRARLAGRVRLGLLCRVDRRFLLVPQALAAGAETHVLWDEFTHPGRFGSRHIPFLAGTWAGVPGTQWAQYVSGVLGMTALAVAGAHWWVRHPPLDPAGAAPVAPFPKALTRRTAWLAWSVVVLAGAVAAAAGRLAGTSPREAAFLAVTHGIGTAAVAALVLAGVWRVLSGWNAR